MRLGEDIVADPARAKRLSKRIATIVASAIEYEIKDPRLAVRDDHRHQGDR